MTTRHGLWLSGSACEIPGHPEGAHGGHPGCITHGPMQYRDGWWHCAGFDGEKCKLVPGPVLDSYATIKTIYEGLI